MKFLGYNFPNINLPQLLSYQPAGWQDSLSFQVTRKAAPNGQQIATAPGSRIRPLLFEPTAMGNLPRLNCATVVGTAINLAKKKVGNLKQTMVHSSESGNKLNLDQAHTEMNLAMQLDAFLTLLEAHAATARRQAAANRFVTDFDLENVFVEADIRWVHRQSNVVSACNACQGVIANVENTWGPKLKSININPSKNA